MKERMPAIYIIFTYFFSICVCFSATVTAFAGISDRAITELKQVEQLPEKNETVDRPNVEYTAEKVKDPFQANIVRNTTTSSDVLQPEEIVPPSVVIQGIIWGGKVPQAIIDNTVVKVGDTIKGDIRILNISKDGVAVFYNNQRFMLSSPAKINLQELEEKRRQ